MALITPYDKPGVPTPGLEGQGVTARGTDPLTDLSGSSSLQTFFDQAVDPSLDGVESPNSVSGLPGLPARTQPSETPPAPPSLQDRNPGTIDQR